MIRLAADADLDAVYQIYEHYVRYSSAIFDREPQDRDRFKETIREMGRDLPVFVSEIAGQVIGYGYVHPAFAKEAYEHDYELTIYFRPGDHHKEPAKLLGLLETAVRQMNGLWLISCITSSNSRSIAFHQRNGFQFMGELPFAGLKQGMWHGVCWFGKALADPNRILLDRKEPRSFRETDLYKTMKEHHD